MYKWKFWAILGLYWFLSMLLVLLFSLFVPSLGHLQQFQLRDGPLWDLDLLAPWFLFLSAGLLVLLGILETRLGFPWEKGGPFRRMLPIFLALWSERMIFIGRSGGVLPGILPLGLGMVWMVLFFHMVRWFSAVPPLDRETVLTPEEGNWGPDFFWTVVFLSFSFQLSWTGYGWGGTVEALAFLALSFLFYSHRSTLGHGSKGRSPWGMVFFGLCALALLAILLFRGGAIG